MTSRVQLSKLPFKFTSLFTGHFITYLLPIRATVPLPPAVEVHCVLWSTEIQPCKILQLLLIPELHVETIITLSTSEHTAVFPSCPTDFCNLNSYDSFEITYLNKIILRRNSQEFILMLKEQQQLNLCVFCGSENLSLFHLHLPKPAAL